MAATRSANYHVDYMDIAQHWHSDSQPYAGGDCLMTALMDGWEMEDAIVREDHWFAGMRSVTIYHFELTKNGETMMMPVINTPYIDRIMLMYDVHLVTMEEFNRKREKSSSQD